MRICHVITRLIIGGAQENTVLTCRGLAQRGHEVTLIAGEETGPEGSLWPKAEQAGCAIIRIPSLRRAVSLFHDWQARRELRRAFEHLRPEVVHTHSSKAGILGRSAANAAGIPAIVHTIHGMSFNRTQPLMVQATYRYLERRAARYTTRFVAVADAMADQAVIAGIADRERFLTIRSGVETEAFTPRAEVREAVRRKWGVAEDEVVVGTIARLFENKGYEEIMAASPLAVARNAKLRFVWIGDGAHRYRYENQLRALGLRDRVRLIGLVDPDRVASYLNGFDMLVHASRWEGLPRAVVQALLMRVPAISFDNDGAPEVVVPGETGLLVRFGDVGALSGAIAQLADDAALRKRLGEEGRKRCLSMFDWQNMVDQLERLYNTLPDQRR
jgi:glycosyltransferase involved in cell wall biosynthesis